MTAMSRIKEHMEVIGADGVHVGTVHRVEENRIKLTKADSGEGRHKGHHHYIDGSLVADVEGNKVRLSANGDVAVTMGAGGLTPSLKRCGMVGSASTDRRQ
jgi:hypothetical protein